jgi:hypothetical protein
MNVVGVGSDFDQDFQQGVPPPLLPHHAHMHRAPPMQCDVKPMGKELVDALRAEFLRLLEPEQFIENLTALEGLIHSTKSLAMALGDPRMLRRGDHVHGTMNGYMGGMGMPGGGTEQFGARSIRELIALIPDAAGKVATAMAKAKAPPDDPVQLVAAIKAAIDAGLDDVAKKLEARLDASVESKESHEPHEPRESHEPHEKHVTHEPNESTKLMDKLDKLKETSRVYQASKGETL